MNTILDRRDKAQERLKLLRSSLSKAEALIRDKACVYATGSFGRADASDYSDLDLFIVGKSSDKKDINGKLSSRLGRLDEICIKADIIHATRKLEIPEFDGDGRYLAHHSAHELIKTLGRPEDDVSNTFTARLLLLLESVPLLETEVYREVIDEVIAEYWLDYEDHKSDFIPAFLANDILRLWRTLCVNYEARTVRQPEEKKAKRKIKNYKLKHSRLLTCYSTLLYLLGTYECKGTVSPADAKEMTALYPLQRLEWSLQQPSLKHAHKGVEDLLQLYEEFLRTTNFEENDLVKKFMDKDLSAKYFTSAHKFGDKVFEVIGSIGGGKRFHRLLVV